MVDQNLTLSYPPKVYHNPTHPIVFWYVLFSLASALHPNSIPTHSDLSWTHLHKHDSQHAHLPPNGGVGENYTRYKLNPPHPPSTQAHHMQGTQHAHLPPMGGQERLIQDINSTHPTPQAPKPTTCKAHSMHTSPQGGVGEIIQDINSTHPTPQAPKPTTCKAQSMHTCLPMGGQERLIQDINSTHPTPQAPKPTTCKAHSMHTYPPRGR